MRLGAYQEDVAWRPQSILQRWRRLSAVAAATVVLFATWAAASARAEGPLYRVAPESPPVSESVGFTNHLNHRVRQLPASLDPPAAESPAQVEARVHVLERGVVIERGGRKPKGHPETAAVEVGSERSRRSHWTFAATGSTAPASLNMAFVGAGVLAVLGLLLGARGTLGRLRSG